MALRLGKSVKQCQVEIDSAEYSEWIAFNSIYPFIIDRSEYAIATLCALTKNMNSKKQYAPEDFLINHEKPRQTPEQIAKTLEQLYGCNQ